MHRIYLTLGKLALLFVLFLLLFQNSIAQNVIVSDDAAYTGEASAILDVKSTDKGMLQTHLIHIRKMPVFLKMIFISRSNRWVHILMRINNIV